MKILKNIVVFIIIFMFITVPILLQPYNDAGVRKFAKDWPTTTATISGIYPERGNQIKRKYKFSYWIDETNLVNKEIAERYTSKLSRKPDGTKVKIHYDPQHTNKIVVVQEDANQIYNRTKDLIIIGCGMIILIVLLNIKKLK